MIVGFEVIKGRFCSACPGRGDVGGLGDGGVLAVLIPGGGKYGGALYSYFGGKYC